MEDLLTALQPASRKRQRWLATASVLGIVGSIAAAAWPRAADDPCAADGPVVAYDAQQQGELAQRFSASGQAGAAETWERLGPRLTLQASALDESRTAICRAYHNNELSTSLHDRALACLARSAAGVEALTASFERIDAETIKGALQLVDEIEPAACADASRLVGRARPRDPVVAAAVTQAERRLESARVAIGSRAIPRRRTSSRRRGATSPLESTRLSTSSSRCAAGRSLRTPSVATTHSKRSPARIDPPRRLTTRSFDSMPRSTSPSSWTRPISRPRRSGRKSQPPWPSALAWGRGRRHSAVMAAFGIAFERGQYLRARELAELALERAQGLAPASVADAHYSIAMAAYWHQDIDDAQAQARQAHDLLVDALGPEHPRVAQTLNLLGHVARKQDRPEDAETFYREALGIFERVLGGDSQPAAAVRGQLAMLAEMRGDLEEAKTEYLAAIEATKRAHGPRSVRVATLYDNYWIALAVGGELVAAEAAFRTALELGIESLGEDHPEDRQHPRQSRFHPGRHGSVRRGSRALPTRGLDPRTVARPSASVAAQRARRPAESAAQSGPGRRGRRDRGASGPDRSRRQGEVAPYWRTISTVSTAAASISSRANNSRW